MHGASLIGHARQRHRAAPKGSNVIGLSGVTQANQRIGFIRDGAGPVGASKKFAAGSGSFSRTVAERKRSGKVRPSDSAKLRTI